MGRTRKRQTYTADEKARWALEVLREEKLLSELASESGIHANVLRQWRDTLREQAREVFSGDKPALRALKEAHEQEKRELYAEIGQLTTQVNWLKKNLASIPRPERVAMIEWEGSELPLSQQADLLGLNQSGLYYQPLPPSAEEIAAKHRLDELYTAYPFYGVNKMTHELQKTMPVGRERVRRYLREMGLSAIQPGPNLSRRGRAEYIHPYRLRGLSIERPDQVWGIDLTYIRLRGGWLYLIAVLDWFSRYVPAWSLVDSLSAEPVTAWLEQAFDRARPEILNSDQGSQFTCAGYVDLLTEAQVLISMDGQGRALDNVFTERLWRSVKYEEVYLQDYTSPREARRGLSRYFDFYNQVRVHQALDYMTPAEVYFGRTGGMPISIFSTN